MWPPPTGTARGSQARFSLTRDHSPNSPSARAGRRQPQSVKTDPTSSRHGDGVEPPLPRRWQEQPPAPLANRPSGNAAPAASAPKITPPEASAPTDRPPGRDDGAAVARRALLQVVANLFAGPPAPPSPMPPLPTPEPWAAALPPRIGSQKRMPSPASPPRRSGGNAADASRHHVAAVGHSSPEGWTKHCARWSPPPHEPRKASAARQRGRRACPRRFDSRARRPGRGGGKVPLAK